MRITDETVDAAIAADAEYARTHQAAWTRISRAQARRILEAAATPIGAEVLADQRASLPYYKGCCGQFTEAAADLVNEHGDWP